MTDNVQPENPASGDAEQAWHIMDLMARLRDLAPAEHEPDRIEVRAERALVEFGFSQGPAPVIAWAQALGFDRPATRNSVELRQTIVESVGDMCGWTVEIRHVRTAPAVTAAIAQPEFRQTVPAAFAGAAAARKHHRTVEL